MLIHKLLKINHLLAISLFCSLMCSCKKTKEPARVSMNIVVMDSIQLEKDDNGKYRVNQELKELCGVIESEPSEDCKYEAIVLNPTLYRIDTKQEISLKTEFKSFSGDVSQIKVIKKLIKKNFNSILELPKSLQIPKNDSVVISTQLSEFLTKKATKDSVVIFSEESEKDFFLFNNHKYKCFDDVDDLKTFISKCICINDKISFTVILNPPRQVKIAIITIKEDTKVITKSSGGKGIKRDLSSNHVSVSEKKNVLQHDEVNDKGWVGRNRTVTEIKNGTIGKKDLENQ